MIEFLSEAVREEFHLLPLAEQKIIHDAAVAYAQLGSVVHILYAERIDDAASEITFRVDKVYHSR